MPEACTVSGLCHRASVPSVFFAPAMLPREACRVNLKILPHGRSLIDSDDVLGFGHHFSLFKNAGLPVFTSPHAFSLMNFNPFGHRARIA